MPVTRRRACEWKDTRENENERRQRNGRVGLEGGESEAMRCKGERERERL